MNAATQNQESEIVIPGTYKPQALGRAGELASPVAVPAFHLTMGFLSTAGAGMLAEPWVMPASYLAGLGDLGVAPVVAGHDVAVPASLVRNVPWQYGKMPPGVLGETDKLGNITIRQGLSGSLFDETLRHEAVHRFLSPRSGPFLGLRADLRMASYQHSHLLRFLEESTAETVATGSLRKGLSLALDPGYGVSPLRLFAETTGYAGGMVGATCLTYQWADRGR
jgi:hypothetical protein